MATNADKDVKSSTSDDSASVTEEDLRKLKTEGEVESSDKETDETPKSEESQEESEGTEEKSQAEESEEESDDDSAEETPAFVKEFQNIKGDTPEEYAKNLEEAYRNSTAEAMRLKNESTQTESSDDEDDVSSFNPDTSDPVSLYMKQKMDQEIDEAYTSFSKNYPQVMEQDEYKKFLRTVSSLSTTILDSEKRLAPPKELYSKAAVILDWKPNESKPTSQEQVGAAVKDSASVTKTNTATKPKTKSKVSDAEVQVAKELWGAGKSDTEIRKELEAVT